MKNSKAKIGLVSISDRASSGTYQDKGIPSLKNGWQKPCFLIMRLWKNSFLMNSRLSRQRSRNFVIRKTVI